MSDILPDFRSGLLPYLLVFQLYDFWSIPRHVTCPPARWRSDVKTTFESLFMWRQIWFQYSLTQSHWRFFRRALIGAHQGGIGSSFPVKKSVISRNPMNSSQFSRSRLFLLVIPSSTFFQMRALSRTVTIEQLSRKIIPRYNRAYKEGVGCQFPRKNSTSSTTSNFARNFGPGITRNSRYRGCTSSRFPQL